MTVPFHLRVVAVLLVLAGCLAIAPLAPMVPAATGAAETQAPAPFSPDWQRVIVRFEGLPVAQVAGVPMDERSKLRLDHPVAVAHRQRLIAQQTAFFEALARECPAAVIDWTYQLVFNGAAVRVAARDVQTLPRLPGVQSVWPQQRSEALLDRSIEGMNADDLWANRAIGGQRKAGEGVKVAVIDYGVFTKHEFFDPSGFRYPSGFPKGEREHCTPKVIACRSFFRSDDPVNTRRDYEDVRDSSSHGTHIAGIIGGTPRRVNVNGPKDICGIAPACHLMAYKILYMSQKGEASVYDGEALAALEAATEDGADVVNNSWGHPVVFAPTQEPINEAITNMLKAGIVVVVAGGNHRQREGTASILSPGCHPDVITVASGNAGNKELEGRSSPGPNLDFATLKPDITAPGVNVVSAAHNGVNDKADGYRAISGTSMAAPHISGLCALLKQAHPQWTPAQIKSAILTTAGVDTVQEPGGGEAAGPLTEGAGWVRANAAASPGFWTDKPSHGVGILTRGQKTSFASTLHSLVDDKVTWGAKVEPFNTDRGLELTLASDRIELAKDGTADVTVDIEVGDNVPFGDYAGTVSLTGGGLDQHLTYWFRVGPAVREDGAQLLLVDYDGSSDRGDPIRDRWTEALTEAKVEHDVWDVTAKRAFPTFADLRPYRAAIVFSGDNAKKDHWDAQASSEFLQWMHAGGALAICGDNLPALMEPLHVGKTAQIRLDGSQDLYDGNIRRGSIKGVAGGPFDGMIFDIAPNRDNAGYPTKLRELRGEFIFIEGLSQPSLQAGATTDSKAQDGYVAFHRASTDRNNDKVPDFAFRVFICTFGVESISDRTRESTRAGFAGALAKWLLGDAGSGGSSATGGPSARIQVEEMDADKGVYAFAIEVTGGRADTVDFDFGDGERIRRSRALRVEHTYRANGRYEVTATVSLRDADDVTAKTTVDVTISAPAVKYAKGTEGYDEFMKVAKLVVPAGHESLSAASVTEAIGMMTNRHRSKIADAFDGLSRRARGNQRELYRDLRAMARD